MTIPVAPPAAEPFVQVPLRPRFFQASAFFPMPIALLGTRDEDGTANLAPYSLCFPDLAGEGHRMALVVRGATKTARFLARSGRVTINFVPDKPEYLANARLLAAPIPTKEKMAKSVFTCLPSSAAAGKDGSAAPPLVAEAVQVFECRLLQVVEGGDGEQRFTVEVEAVWMQPYWARVLEAGRSGPRLPVDYGLRPGSHSWTSRPVVVVSGPRLRPQFAVEVGRPAERVIDDFRAALHRPDAPVVGKIRGSAVQLGLPSAEVTTWSPSMELSVEPSPEGCVLYARIGPQPQVWTTFMFFHLLILMLWFSGLMWGLSQWFSGGDPWALWSVPAGLFLNAFVAGAAFIGQGLGAEQIYRLRSFVDEVVGP